ncbi:MAG TPA: cohesin domain-containing protein [Terriglobales bacterium]|nr:cohesin domain-containing protein [Terriglobales bacterium]
MRRLVRLAGLALALLVCTQGFADEASTAFKRGANAEAQHKFVDAYDSYKKACDLKPSDIKYQAACTRMRLYASSQLLLQGVNLRDKGQLEEARAMIARATAIDPANFYAAQELKRTELMIERQKSGTPAVPPSPISNLAQEVSPAVELHPISNTPITLRMTEDAKTVYTTIGKLAGLNVLFDPDYTSRRISIELNGVTLYQALEIAALESKTFWRPVTPNTIFVAADTPAKRKELEQNVVKTFYLGNVSSPNDLQDAVNTIRQILDVSRIQQIASQSAIVVRGTPDQIAMAEKLLNDIDKAKPEVVVEVAVMQVTRDKVRNLGITPPTSASIGLQSPTTTTTSTSSTSSSTTTGSTTTNGSLTLNQLANLNANYFQVSIPTASVTALMTDSDTKIIQKPQIRALDNQKATLKIGDRIPVATGSFQPGIGGVGINPLVNTQFQYIDVGVNIDITPRIHANHDVTLKLTLEISNVTGQSSIGGISQPIIGQRRIEHEIRLHDGEVNLLGGILEDSDTQSLNGYPGLARIPILRYFFAQSNKERRENEIVFALVPHIVRAQDLSQLNNTAVDVGTATAIELRHTAPSAPVSQPPLGQPSATPAPAQPMGNAQPVTPAIPQPAGIQPGPTQPPVPPGAPVQPESQQQPVQPPNGATPQAQLATAPPGQGTLQAGNATLSFEPPTITQAANSTFMVNLSMGNAQNVFSVPAQISYDPKVLQLVNVSNGGLLGKDGQPVALVHRDDAASGTLQVTATRPPGSGGVSGQGPVFSLTFMAKAAGQTTLAVRQVSARDPNMQPIPVAGGQAMVTVK